MSVFLRWGVFGILAVAALLYAYNASKRLAEKRDAHTAPAAAAAPDSEDALIPVPGKCELELRVAERALEARRDQEPLDKLFRARIIAFENDPARRARLEKVAADWYLLEGDEPSEAVLRREVVEDCESVTPGP